MATKNKKPEVKKAKKPEAKKPLNATSVEEIEENEEQDEEDFSAGGTTTVVPASTGGYIVTNTGADGSWSQSIEDEAPTLRNDEE